MKKSLLAGLAMTLAVSGCANNSGWDSMSNTQKGAIIGTLGGAAAGAAISHNHRGRGALIGAVGGALAGAAIGNYMDQQKRELDINLASEVQAGNIVIQQYSDKSIKVTMTSTTAFDTNSYQIKPGFYPTLNKIGNTLVKYPKTTLAISGHTDNQGKDAINQPLSENRARAVSGYLGGRGVYSERMSVHGRGRYEPRASNATEAGRQLNRRVEILIAPITE